MQNSKSQASTKVQQSNEVEAMQVKPNLYKTNVSGSLLSDEAIEIQAKKMTTFPEMCYLDKIMEIQCGHKYNEGAKWARDILINQIENKPMLSDEEIREPIENALYATKRFLTTQATELAEGIVEYLKDAGFTIVRNDR